jgi:ribosomal protein S4
MTKNQALVDYLADGSSTQFKHDTSTARRAIVEGRIKVDGEVVTDPSFRLPFETGFVVEVAKNKETI